MRPAVPLRSNVPFRDGRLGKGLFPDRGEVTLHSYCTAFQSGCRAKRRSMYLGPDLGSEVVLLLSSLLRIVILLACHGYTLTSTDDSIVLYAYIAGGNSVVY